MKQKINLEIASAFRKKADKMEAENKNIYRVVSYRKAADSLDKHDEALDVMYKRSWIKGIEKIPGIGNRLARVIEAELKMRGIKR